LKDSLKAVFLSVGLRPVEHRRIEAPTKKCQDEMSMIILNTNRTENIFMRIPLVDSWFEIIY